MDAKNLVANNIRGYRNKMGVSQEALADYANVNRSYIGDLERGRYNITVTVLFRIAKALKVDPSVLLVKDSYKEK